MVTKAEIARIAMRHDTVIARAFLRALGLHVPHVACEYADRIPVEHIEYDEGVLWCFSNHGSPMDGRY